MLKLIVLVIWDEALAEFSLIHIGSWSLHNSLEKPIPHNKSRAGLNPAHVALSCREAADRWFVAPKSKFRRRLERGR